MKDLTKVRKDLQKVIIIDNIAENFALQPNNGI
jgi:TFIIF-interacting CTD phosphatase-like protein